MLPSLWLNSASSTPSELIIREGEQVLGRSADADICLNETFVSGYHARLNWQNSQLTILDLESTNGTLINGVPVVGWTSLTDGDIVEFGGVDATVRLPMLEAPNPVIGSTVPPPPPEPSRRRRRPMDTPAVGVEEINLDDDRLAAIDLDANVTDYGHERQNDAQIQPTVTTNTEELGDFADSGDPARARPVPGRVFGSRLGPVVSSRTEPLFDQPLTSAVTVPPTPPSGVSATSLEPDLSDSDSNYELGNGDLESGDLGNGDFDRNDEGDPRSSLFDHKGLRLTIGTAVLVLVALLTVAALIIYFTR